MNQLEFGSKKKTLYSIAILHSKRFRRGRSITRKGRMLFNKELRMAKAKIKQYGIRLTKKLPAAFKR